MAQYSRKLKRGIRWWYKFDYDSKTYSSKCIYISKSEARKAESAKFEELSANKRNPSNKLVISLLEAINERLDYIKASKSNKYYLESKHYFTILIKQFGQNTILNTISKSDFNELFINISKEQKKRCKDNYKVNAMIRSYKALYNHVINGHDLEIKNPLIGIKPFSVKKKLKYIPSDNDIKNVQIICNSRQNLLIDFIKETGARINEALNLKGSDISDKYVVLYTRKSKDSNLVPRKIPRPECLTGVKINSDNLLFLEWRKQPKFLARKVRSLKQIPWGFHNLRHRYASLLSKQGKPIYEIMSLLGHSNLSTTQIYLQTL